MTFALTPTGISVQTIDEIRTELEDALRAPDGVHPQLDVGPTSIFGQLIGIWAEREMLLQQQVRAVAQSFGPRATGAALASLALLTGTVKKGPTKSRVDVALTLSAGTTVPAGSRANVAGDTTAVFETLADVTNPTVGTAVFVTQMAAVDPGPKRAPAATLTVINTPVSGWLAVTNALDADVGRDFEVDPALRTRRLQELARSGSTILDAIEVDVLGVAGVIQTRGYENTGASTDADGLPAHSFEIVVWDGVSPAASTTEIAQAIFDAKPAGIGPARSLTGTLASGVALDREGAAHAVIFSRALQLPLYVGFELVTNSDFPLDGAEQVRTAFVTAAHAMLGIGDDVIVSRLYASAYSVAGVVDVSAIKVGFAPAPSASVNLVVGSRAIAIADSSRVTVTT